MSQLRPILLIAADSDIQLFEMALGVLNVEAPVQRFAAPEAALDFLSTTPVPPRLIFCDYQLAASSGIDLRNALSQDAGLQGAGIPIVLLTSGLSQAEIQKVFELPVQGLFQKELSFEKYLDLLDRILRYWAVSITPASRHDIESWR